MCWIISSTSLTRRDKKFLKNCKDDAVNKSIPIIDETQAEKITRKRLIKL